MNAKLSRTNGILSKLRHYVPKKTMLSVYYALFYSHMTYGSLVWSLTPQKNLVSSDYKKKVSESLTLQLLINILTLYF